MQISYLKFILYVVNMYKHFILEFPLREHVGSICGKFDISAAIVKYLVDLI